MRAKLRHKRVAFTRRTLVSDGAGGATETWAPLCSVWAQFSPERGRERIQAGRLNASLAGVLRLLSSTAAREITVEDRVTVDGQLYDIRAISNPDQRNIMLEMTIESVV